MDDQNKSPATARIDALTGLPTGRSVRSKLQGLIDRQTSSLAVFVVDLDRFKAISDNCGHGVGDEVLRQCAHRLRRLSIGSDVVGRDVGDEFLIVVSDESRVIAAATIGEAIRAELAKPFLIGGRTLRVTASLGIATSVANQMPDDDLLRDAGTALFVAKARGGDTVVSFSRAMARGADRRAWGCDLVRAAIQNQGVVVNYQPIVDADGCVVAVEALARCRSASGKLHEPAEFLDAITRTPLVVALDRAVLSQSLDLAASWASQPTRAPRWVAVNFAARTISDPDCADQVLAALQRRDLPASSLVIEITESAAFEIDEDVLAGLTRLRDAGVGIALDDFGTGYSSLSHLVNLPLSILKIDKTFIQGVDRPCKEQAVAQAVVALGVALGLTVVAEGVETRSQEQAVRNLGVQHIQGWRTAPALALCDLHAMLAEPKQMDCVG